MLKNYFVRVLILLFISTSSFSQIDANSVMGIPTGTLSEITTITDALEGAFAYATDTDKLYTFNGAIWSEVTNNIGSAYMGVFIISATGNQTIAGIPFQPSQISFVAHANVETLNLNSDNGTNNNNSGISNSFGTSNGFARDDNGTIIQQNIYVGGSGNSINDISRYASSAHCIGVRYGNQNGDSLGLTTASVISFNLNGFTLNVDNLADNLVVIYQAYD